MPRLKFGFTEALAEQANLRTASQNAAASSHTRSNAVLIYARRPDLMIERSDDALEKLARIGSRPPLDYPESGALACTE
jgi:hypothetical protein